jgi:3'-phosphoadenosine 5'-phosphosulfate sulfotransferase (PAPS reductase)/FAD synthetase
MQSVCLEEKVKITQGTLLEFCYSVGWNVSLSFSGGADSSTLFNILCHVWQENKKLHNNSKLLVLYANTSNEFMTMPKFVRYYCDYMAQKHDIQIDLRIVKGKETFVDVCKTQGYPVVSKKVSRMVRDVQTFFKENGLDYDDIKDHIDKGVESAEYLRKLNFSQQVILRLTGITGENRVCKTWAIPKKWRKLIASGYRISEKCCDVLKKAPLDLADKTLKANPIIGTLAEDSIMRRNAYLQTGCVSFKGNKVRCTPLGFWLRQDVLRYIDSNKLPIAPPYGELICHDNGSFEFTKEHNTGCKLCLFGAQLEKQPNRIQRLKDIEPATYNFAMKPITEGGLGYKEIMDYCGIAYE